jgi:hypothetical protein
MKNYFFPLFVFLSLFFVSTGIKSQNIDNCNAALPICAAGQYPIDFTTSETIQPSCIDYPVAFKNARWIKISGFATAGIMEFDFIPDSGVDDIDFIVYKGSACTSLNELRCIASGPILGENLHCLGSTGLKTEATNTSINAGCSTGNYGSAIPVLAGDVYYILVNNFNSNQKCVFDLKIDAGLAGVLRDTLAPRSYVYCSNSTLPTLYYNLSKDSADGIKFRLGDV